MDKAKVKADWYQSYHFYELNHFHILIQQQFGGRYDFQSMNELFSTNLIQSWIWKFNKTMCTN